MKKVKYLILGAGPSGLTIANALLMAGCSLDEIIVLEGNSEVGGLCRSKIVDGSPLDIGGGHFLDVKRKEVLDFLFQFMPQDEWQLFNRISKIRIQEKEIDHPLEANLWQFSSDIQADFLESIARAGCVRGEPEPNTFSEWISWKFGDLIAEQYMLPYNKKIWSMNLELLGIYWLYKLPNVSFRETLLSCLEGVPNGSLPAHGTFFYPKQFGYGEVWRRMGEALKGSLITNCEVSSLDLNSLLVNGKWQAQKIITTIPWTFWPSFCDVPGEIKKEISTLKKSAIDVEYHNKEISSSAHWIYEPDEKIAHHRLLLRKNFLHGARGYWTETNSLRTTEKSKDIFHNEFAYPLNTLGKPESVKKILNWASEKNISALGRWGTWEHMNSDVAVEQALAMAKEISSSREK